MQTPLARLLHAASLIICLSFVGGFASAAESDPDGKRYAASADPAADVSQALERAAANDRRALVVLGANWCHDSRALAARLYKSPLEGVVAEDYELVFVDVGFYEDRTDVLSRLDVAQYYATPTVLIVDPASGQVVNHEDRHMWGAADSISMASSVEYFETWSSKQPATDGLTESASELNAQIDDFEQQQAERVAAGYAVVGPMLEQRVAGNSPDDFFKRWNELGDFRNAIPKDVQALREEASRRVAEGEQDVQLEFPEYPAMSWETRQD